MVLFPSLLSGLPRQKVCLTLAKASCGLRQHDERAARCGDCGGKVEERPILDSNYAMLDELGGGTFGTVYAALNLAEGRRVAIKLLVLNQPGTEERFAQEARVTRRLRHPNIVEVGQCKRANNGSLYIEMEHLEGRTLKSWLSERRSVPWEEARPLCTQLLSAMALAHREGVVHRDLKPTNILLCPASDGSEVLKVLDFGIAKVLGGAARGTVTGEVLMTPLYSSPEQMRGEARPHPGIDVYALALIMIEMLTGRVPPLEERMKGRPLDELSPVLRARVPRRVFRVLQRALLDDAPGMRWQDAGAFEAALTQLPPRWPRVLAQASGALVVALLTWGVVRLVTGPQVPPGVADMDRTPRDAAAKDAAPTDAAPTDAAPTDAAPHVKGPAIAPTTPKPGGPKPGGSKPGGSKLGGSKPSVPSPGANPSGPTPGLLPPLLPAPTS